jgi:predicted nucleotide-binding protein (sugar kinase/HSP70/actin superfamily)
MGATRHHFRRPVERPLLPEERSKTRILMGVSLSPRHERLMAAGVEGLGYRVELLPPPSKADYQTGREYGNNGYCNPNHFIAGALINHLLRLRDERGVPVEKILSDYCFITAGACGPCRFGMYEAEYRLALRNAGFDGFRVLLFKVTRGLQQSDSGIGLRLDTVFFLALVNAILLGDLWNELAHHILPYAVDRPRAEAVFERCLGICERALRDKDDHSFRRGLLARLAGGVLPPSGPADGAALLDQLRGRHYTDALDRCRRLIDEEVEIDPLRAKPVVKTMGEFWAQHTISDGNFRMPVFLEQEGAEVLVEPVGTWLDYLVNEARMHLDDRRGIPEGEDLPRFWELGRRLRTAVDYRRKRLFMVAGAKILRATYERFRRALGGTAHALACQREMARIAHPFYNSRAAGGEGHLEVAKNIYYHQRGLAHMVLSLKPFGCMPSTQSDGAQAAVMARYPEINFLPLETSGDGEISALSRVQMALGEAKAKCKAEFRRCLERSGYTFDEIRAHVAAHRELRRPLFRLPEYPGVVGRAARTVLHVAERLDRERERLPEATRPALQGATP